MERRVVGAGLLGAFDAERFADRFVIAGLCLDLFYQGAKARFDAGRDGGHGRGERGRDRLRGGRQVASTPLEVVPASPLAGAVLHDLLAGKDVTEVIGIVRLRFGLGGGEAKRGGITGDGVLEGLELGGEAVVGGTDVAGFGHKIIESEV
ncbi:MAG: hypothetical protein QOE26_1082 [Verrucomicrobiota bacterium]